MRDLIEYSDVYNSISIFTHVIFETAILLEIVFPFPNGRMNINKGL